MCPTGSPDFVRFQKSFLSQKSLSMEIIELKLSDNGCQLIAIAKIYEKELFTFNLQAEWRNEMKFHETWR